MSSLELNVIMIQFVPESIYIRLVTSGNLVVLSIAYDELRLSQKKITIYASSDRLLGHIVILSNNR